MKYFHFMQFLAISHFYDIIFSIPGSLSERGRSSQAEVSFESVSFKQLRSMIAAFTR